MSGHKPKGLPVGGGGQSRPPAQPAWNSEVASRRSSSSSRRKISTCRVGGGCRKTEGPGAPSRAPGSAATGGGLRGTAAGRRQKGNSEISHPGRVRDVASASAGRARAREGPKSPGGKRPRVSRSRSYQGAGSHRLDRDGDDGGARAARPEGRRETGSCLCVCVCVSARARVYVHALSVRCEF